jgi:inositol-1,3,4-trisphosphate 5/6-kinase/inositol-tetrakisphosphate 1-kinase
MDDDSDSITTADLEQPILVGYAFGPKKMSTMATVMAEASRTTVVGVVERITEEEEEEDIADAFTTSKLTSAALSLHQEGYFHEEKTSVPFSSPVGVKSIVRYFRSSCSSVGSDDACSNTSTTGSFLTSITKHSSNATASCPVRVSFVPVDLNEPLEEQQGGSFDVLLHKMTEDILCLSNATEDDSSETLQQARQRIERLQNYQRANPRCCLADDPNRVQVVMSRSAISATLQNALLGITSESGLPVETPKFCVLQDSDDAVLLRYPLIAKPLPAAGTKKSHCMGIVFNQTGLESVGIPCLLQEYENHNGVLFKVYVLGQDIFVFSRPSLPNLPTEPSDLETLKSFVEFDSQRPYPDLAHFGLTQSSASPHAVTALTALEVTPVVDALKSAFGLQLFGFDILVSEDSKLLVVDVNYFPSFKEVSNFPSLLAKFLVQRAVQTRKAANPSMQQKNRAYF